MEGMYVLAMKAASGMRPVSISSWMHSSTCGTMIVIWCRFYEVMICNVLQHAASDELKEMYERTDSPVR